jgi:hypothetical protein
MYVLYFLSQNYTIYTIEITFTIDKNYDDLDTNKLIEMAQ